MQVMQSTMCETGLETLKRLFTCACVSVRELGTPPRLAWQDS